MNQEITIKSTVELPEYYGMKPEYLINRENWNGHSFALFVGIVHENGEIVSHLQNDKRNENTFYFEIMLKDVELYHKKVRIEKGDQLVTADYYFVPYEVKDHPSLLPTIDSKFVEGASNVEYTGTYEVLMVMDESYKRYLYIDFKTKGMGSISLYDMIRNLDDSFETFFDEKSHGFSHDEDGYYVDFYDKTGDKVICEQMSYEAFLSMIASVRLVKLDCKII